MLFRSITCVKNCLKVTNDLTTKVHPIKRTIDIQTENSVRQYESFMGLYINGVKEIKSPLMKFMDLCFEQELDCKEYDWQEVCKESELILDQCNLNAHNYFEIHKIIIKHFLKKYKTSKDAAQSLFAYLKVIIKILYRY